MFQIYQHLKWFRRKYQKQSLNHHDQLLNSCHNKENKTCSSIMQIESFQLLESNEVPVKGWRRAGIQGFMSQRIALWQKVLELCSAKTQFAQVTSLTDLPLDKMATVSDDIFKSISFTEKAQISTKLSLKFVPNGPIKNIPALIQIIAGCRPGNEPLFEPMLMQLLNAYMRHYGEMSQIKALGCDTDYKVKIRPWDMILTSRPISWLEVWYWLLDQYQALGYFTD